MGKATRIYLLSLILFVLIYFFADLNWGIRYKILNKFSGVEKKVLNPIILCPGDAFGVRPEIFKNGCIHEGWVDEKDPKLRLSEWVGYPMITSAGEPLPKCQNIKDCSFRIEAFGRMQHDPKVFNIEKWRIIPGNNATSHSLL